jgi:DNA-binding response OmpR family regulator
MPKRQGTGGNKDETGGAGGPPEGEARGRAPATLRVLAADPCVKSRTALRKALEALGASCRCASSLTQARRALASGGFDLVILDREQADGDALDLVRQLAAAPNPVRCIVTSSRSNFDDVVQVMRSGALDFVAKPYRASEIAGRVIAAMETDRRLRESERKVRKLRRICRRLNTAREEVTRQVDVLCNDLVHAYQELADQMTSASLAGEFASLVRQDLDVEDLLRTTLEYLLRHTGHTNAAVFLPTGNHDFNLGAYVNYDIPRDTADVLLDHLADVIAPRFEHETGLHRMAGREDLAERLGEQAHWLDGRAVIVFSCRHEGDCLAVVALFRDKKHPFPDEVLPLLATVRDVFAHQLARVVRIHHRHRPHLEWPGFDVEDDRGLAA